MSTCTRTKVLRSRRWSFATTVHGAGVGHLRGLSVIHLGKLRTISLCLRYQLALRRYRAEAA
jgi:hypothetical protein